MAIKRWQERIANEVYTMSNYDLLCETIKAAQLLTEELLQFPQDHKTLMRAEWKHNYIRGCLVRRLKDWLDK